MTVNTERHFHSHEIEELHEVFHGIAHDCRNDLDDARCTPARMSEMNKRWVGRQLDSEEGNNYCKELHRSATLCAHAPETFSASEAKQSAFLIKQCRETADILEIEIPMCYLTTETLKSLGRSVDPDEVVIMHVNQYSGESCYLIERDTPNLTPEECRQHSTLLDKAIAKEWASWNDHNSFKPILRSVAKNIIDARWVHKWKMIDNVKAI